MQTYNEMRQHVAIFYGAFILLYTGLIRVGGWDTQEKEHQRPSSQHFQEYHVNICDHVVNNA